MEATHSNKFTVPTKTKIKALIGFRIDIKCNSKLGLMYLARDRPKMITKVTTNHPTTRKIANLEMYQLCEALRSLKGTKKMVLHIGGYTHQQQRILAKWLKTSRNIKTLELIFPWGARNQNNGIIEILFFLRNVKSLSDLTLEVFRNDPFFRFEDVKPFLRLKDLSNLRKLKISGTREVHINSTQSMLLLDGLQRIDRLAELQLDMSFLSVLGEREVRRIMEYLKGTKNLLSLRLKFKQSVGKILIDELVSYLSSLQKLKSLHLEFSSIGDFLFEDIEKLITSIKSNNTLETLVLLTARAFWHKKGGKQLRSLNLETLSQLRSLKLSLSGDSKAINKRLLQDTAEVLKGNPQLETVHFEFLFRPLSSKYFKLLCKGLQTLTSLTSFTLSLNHALDSFNHGHMEDLTRSLKSFKRLENLHLSFSSCALSRKNVALIAESVNCLQGLKTLYLDFSYPPPAKFLDSFSFSSKIGLKSFGPVFQKHKSLSSITLLISDLKPTDQELQDLAAGIGGLKTLTSFKLVTTHWSASLNSLYKSLAKLPAFSSLDLQLGELKHQDLEDLFKTLQVAQNLRKLGLGFAVESLSEKAIENFIKMIQGLVNLNSMKLSVFWDKDIDIEMITKFLDGRRYFDRPMDGFWKASGEQWKKCEEILKQNSKYLKPQPSPIRYRSLEASKGQN